MAFGLLFTMIVQHLPSHKKSMKRKRSDLVECVIPIDIGLKIVSSLEAVDVCSLASCSRFWREVCGYDHVWEPLCRDRWGADSLNARLKGWREFYSKKHKEMEAEMENKLANYLQQLSSFGLVERGHYLKALKDLRVMHLPLKEVEFLFFKTKVHVLLKLVALHYCILFLRLPVESLRAVLVRCKMVNKRVCIRWSKAKKCRGFYHFVTCSFGDLLMQQDDLVFIGRRDFYSSLQVQISAA